MYTTVLSKQAYDEVTALKIVEIFLSDIKHVDTASVVAVGENSYAIVANVLSSWMQKSLLVRKPTPMIASQQFYIAAGLPHRQLTDREYRALSYLLHRDPYILKRQYNKEAEFLKKTKEFISLMTDKAYVVREAAATVNGVADLIMCYNDKFIALELKAKDGKPSKQQQLFVEKIVAIGGAAAICSTLLEVWDTMHKTVLNS